MSHASLASIDRYPDVLSARPLGLDLAALARETKVLQRPRGARSAADLVRLALAWGPGGYCLQRAAAWAGERGIATLSDEALVQRLHTAAGFLQAVTSKRLDTVAQQPCWPCGADQRQHQPEHSGEPRDGVAHSRRL